MTDLVAADPTGSRGTGTRPPAGVVAPAGEPVAEERLPGPAAGARRGRTHGRRFVVLTAVGLTMAAAVAGTATARLVGGSSNDQSATPPGVVLDATPTTTATTAAAPVAATVAGAGTKSTIRTVDFANFTYAPDTCDGYGAAPAGGFPVRNGEYHNDDQTRHVWLLSATISYGDLTRDGNDEAVVILGCAGASGSTETWVYTPDVSTVSGVGRLAPVQIEPEVLAFYGLARAQMATATIADERLVTTWDGYTAGDPHCCPSKRVSARQRWTGLAWQVEGLLGVQPMPEPAPA